MSNPPAESLVTPVVVPAEQSRWYVEEVHPHYGPLKNYIRGAFGIRDAEDIAQEACLKTWNERTSQPIKSVKAFLYTVAKHLSLNALRSKRRSPIDYDGSIIASGVLEDRPSVADVITEQEKLDFLIEALAELPARTSEILILHKIDGFSQADVARRFGLTEKAVSHQVARGVQRCTQFFRSRGHEFF